MPNILDCHPDKHAFYEESLKKRSERLGSSQEEQASMGSEGTESSKGNVSASEVFGNTNAELFVFQWHNNEILFYETLGRLSSQLQTVPMFYYGKKFDEVKKSINRFLMRHAFYYHGISWRPSECVHI